MFFDKQYTFKGKHAKYVIELKEQKHVFRYNMDVLLLAPILGLVYNRKANIDKESEFASLETTVFAEQMNGILDKNLFNYRLCMLLNMEKSDEERKENAFKYYTEFDISDEASLYSQQDIENAKKRLAENIDEFNSYILGGVEILYERLLDNGNVDTREEITKNITEFVSDYIDEASNLEQDIEEWS